MPRVARNAPKGLIYHALNRAVARLPLFEKVADYEAFERVVGEAHARFPLEVLAYCVMPNHWHFVLRPLKEGQLTAFLRWVAHVNAPQTEAELESLRQAVRRNSPFGNPNWQQSIAKRLGLQSTLRPRGRPRKNTTP